MNYTFRSRIPIGNALGLALLAMVSATAAADTYDLSWNAIAGGGTSSATGGVYSLGATIGQAATGPLSGGSYNLVSGFWPAETATAPPPHLVQAVSRKVHGAAGKFDLPLTP